MTDPTTLDEYNATAKKNSKVTGHGLDTTLHVPCPGCAGPGWKTYKIIDAEEEFVKTSVCQHCGRGFKLEVHRAPGVTGMKLVQTSGPDCASWVPVIRDKETV